MKSWGVLHLYAAVVRQSVEQPYSTFLFHIFPLLFLPHKKL